MCGLEILELFLSFYEKLGNATFPVTDGHAVSNGEWMPPCGVPAWVGNSLSLSQ